MTKYEQWAKNLKELDDKINSISPWNDYAEMLQSRYDQMLEDEPAKD